MITYGHMIHRRVGGLPSARTTHVYQLEFVDRGFYDEWIKSSIVVPRGLVYKGQFGRGYVWDTPDADDHKSIANVVVFYVDEERQHHITKLRVDDDAKINGWLFQLSLQPKDFEGPGRPPKRYLEMSNWAQRARRR